MILNPKIIEVARSTAIATPGIKRYKLGAVLFDKKERIINAKGNLRKTHPALLQFTQFPYLHAESHSILAHGIDNCSGLQLCVVRCDPHGNFRLSRPCESCVSIMSFAGLKGYWYSDNDQRIQYIKCN